MVMAKAVTIESGAEFSMSVVGRGILNAGTVAAATTSKRSYQGGDGNDLTLTVVP